MWSWREFIALAERLDVQNAQTNYDLARLRSAISRAYYAVYNLTQDYMLVNHNIAKTSQHKEYWESLRDNAALSPDEHEVARQGLSLRTMRNYADYQNPHIDPTWEEAGKDAVRKKFRQRLMTEAQASIIEAYHVCLLLKQPLPRGRKTPPYIPSDYLAP